MRNIGQAGLKFKTIKTLMLLLKYYNQIQVLAKLVSETEPRGNWCKTLVGDECELEDRSASARGPPIEAMRFIAHPAAAQLTCGCSRSAWPSWCPGSSPSPVDNFSDTSDDEFPGIEMEREVAEFIGLALLPPRLSASWSDLGQSSKKCRNIWPSDLPSPETALLSSKRSLFSVLDSEELPEDKGTWRQGKN